MGDLDERIVTIHGVKVTFPCKPYPSQFSMMDRVIKGLERKQNCLLESPTGSGKSLALLCSALAWQVAQHEKVAREQMFEDLHEGKCCKCSAIGGDKEKIKMEEKLNQEKNLNTAEESTVGIGDDQDEANDDDDDDFKPMSKFRTPGTAQGATKPMRKHQGISYETSPPCKEDDACTSGLRTSSDGVDECKCTCAEENTKKKKKVPKIYFGTRTHKQIAQIVRELKKTAYHDVRMVILSSREHTCVHPEVVRLKSKNEGCKERIDPRGPGCKFFDKSKRVFLTQNQLQAHLPTAWDIEDFVRACKSQKACPYFITRNIKDDADIIFCPYNYLIDPNIRRSMEINPKDQIIILDEAHNMEDSAREAASACLKSEEIEAALKNLNEMINNNIKPVEHRTLVTMLENLEKFIEDNSTNLEEDYDQAYKCWSGFDIVARLKNINLGPNEVKEYLAVFMNVTAPAEEETVKMNNWNKEVKLKSSTLQTFEHLFQVFLYMYKDDMKFVEDYRVAVVRTTSYVREELDTNNRWVGKHHRQKRQPTVVYSLNFWCMNPGVAFADFHNSHSIVLSSGTLSPMSSFQSELGTPFPIQLEANHVIKDNQVWVGTLGQGPKGAVLQAVYRNMETLCFQDELGQLIFQVCKTVPHGVLCFLPSYRALEKFTERWKKTSLWREISKRKRIMVEPRAADKADFEETMRYFYNVINETYNGSDEEYEDNSEVDGALFFAVCRGKVSEGLDFADNNARAVITVGIPFPSIKDYQVKLKREYNDRHQNSRGLLSGNEWYEIQAFRALNQALGRCIRHRKDWGALIVVDDRFVKNGQKYCKGLSKWVRSKVQPFQTCSSAMNSLSNFTQHMLKEMPSFQPDTSFIPCTPSSAPMTPRVSAFSHQKEAADTSLYTCTPDVIRKDSKLSKPLTNYVPQKPSCMSPYFNRDAPGTSPKGDNPSAKQNSNVPVSVPSGSKTPTQNPSYQQLMEAINSTGVPKDKPYYVILNKGLPNEQTFLVEPPPKSVGSKQKVGEVGQDAVVTTGQKTINTGQLNCPSGQVNIGIGNAVASVLGGNITGTTDCQNQQNGNISITSPQQTNQLLQFCQLPTQKPVTSPSTAGIAVASPNLFGVSEKIETQEEQQTGAKCDTMSFQSAADLKEEQEEKKSEAELEGSKKRPLFQRKFSFTNPLPFSMSDTITAQAQGRSVSNHGNGPDVHVGVKVKEEPDKDVKPAAEPTMTVPDGVRRGSRTTLSVYRSGDSVAGDSMTRTLNEIKEIPSTGTMPETKDTSDEEFAELNTRRRRGKRKRFSLSTGGTKRNRGGADFLDGIQGNHCADQNENVQQNKESLACAKCGSLLLSGNGLEKRRRFPDFMKGACKKRNTEVIFINDIQIDPGSSITSQQAQVSDGLTLNCMWDSEVGCCVQYLRCVKCGKRDDTGGIIGARVLHTTTTDYTVGQTWLVATAVRTLNT